MTPEDARRTLDRATLATAVDLTRGRRAAMKAVAFVSGLCILAVGAIGFIAPAVLVGIAREFVAAGAPAFYAIALVRVAFGLALIAVASASRAPRAVRVLGSVIVFLGVTRAVTGRLGIDRARASFDWWLRQGSGAVRLTGVLIMALGGFVAYALAPVRRPRWPREGAC